MRDLLSKLDALISETALKDKEDLEAKRKALADLEADPVASKDPEISAAIDQRRSDLEKEAKAKSIGEETVDESGLQRYTGIKKYGKDGFEALQKAGREGADEEEKGRIKDKYLKKESFEVGDEFGISFSEDFEIATHIVDILEDGIVIELDDTAMEYLALEGFTYEDGELVEGVVGPKSCWKGYRKVGTKPGTGKNAGKRVNDCEKIDEYFQFEFPKGKDRGPRDHGTDELERREKSFRKHELAKDGRDYKEKDKYGDTYKIKGPKGKLPEGEEGFSIEDMVMDQYRNGNEVWEIASNMGMSEDEVQDIINDSGQGMSEAEYQGRKVPLGKPMAGDVKKSKVYVKNPQGNVVKVNFGDKKMRIKKSNPARKKSFRARHNCDNPGPRHKARYWSCRSW